MNPFSLSGKTALVAGGGTGIGLGIAKAGEIYYGGYVECGWGATVNF